MEQNELLKPRFKVIASYPNSPFEIGKIIKTISDDKETNDLVIALHEPYPHLFKRLEWWEDRKTEDMPEYLIFIRNYHKAKKGDVIKVRVFDYNSIGNVFAVWDINNEGYNLSDKDLLPATKAEYDAQSDATQVSDTTKAPQTTKSR